MPLTSAGTYARAFKAETNLPQAAGNYENKLATKFAKGMVGVFTLGIGYGIFRLIEHYCNVRPKVAEFCANAEGIHANLMAASALQKKTVECNLKSGGQLRLEEISVGPNGESVVRISDDNHTDEVPGTFKEICVKLEQEFETAPGLYALSERYKTLAAFSEMNALKIAPIINGPEPQFLW
ncbi:effector protein steA [Salmonella enterica subsp. diarizonae]|nr:effector protein steA [Salmonella enterica subsp. diarizonae]EKN5803582.1 effector protein steA [Salmonella enterica subsp. enterica]